MDSFFISALVILGAIGGFLAGLLGIGGGILFVPIMEMLFSTQHLPPHHVTHMAIATTMAIIFFTALSSTRIHHRHQAVQWSLVFTITPGLFIGTLLGGKVFSWLHPGLLALLFSLFIGFSSWQILRNAKVSHSSRSLPGTMGLLLSGTIIGFISSLVGVGGGFISVPFLTWHNVSIRKAIGTSAALGIPVAAFSTLNNIFYGYKLPDLPAGALGYVYLPALFCVAGTSIFIAPIGATLTHQINTLKLKRIFAWFLSFLAVYMLFQSLQAYGWIRYLTLKH